ncbi:MAG: prepilin-type N-terminal cleavage/methylation domain-containing protein [Planctomycetota bacterium]
MKQSVMQSGRRVGKVRSRGAFTLVELIAVIVVLGVLAAVAVPKYFDYADRAKTASLEGSLGGVRSSISSFYANQTFEGSARFPTITEIRTVGTVLEQSLPKNPFNGLSTIGQVNSLADATNRVTDGSTGWRYFVDNTANPPVAIFWSNNTDDTTVADSNGAFVSANDL